MWKWKAAIAKGDTATPTSNAIVGVRKKNKTTGMYNGLCHYLYRGSSKFYSWGDEFLSLADANPDYEICYAITVTKT